MRATLALPGQPLTPFFVVLGLPTVALSPDTLAPSLWTDSAANAATASFHSEPGIPLIGTTDHSASTFAGASKFPTLEAWWSDPTTWWAISGSDTFHLVMTSADTIPADFDQLRPALAHLWAANCMAL